MSEASDRRRRLALLERAVEERGYLLGIRDVLGYAVGFRVRDGETTDEPALTVYVSEGRKATDKADHPRHQRIPNRVRLKVDGETVWLPVDLVESEVGRLQQPAPRMAGVSLGNADTPEFSGTIGWVGRRDGNPVVCGSFHVLLRDELKGSDIRKRFDFDGTNYRWALSPSATDGGRDPQDSIGLVLAGCRDNYVDVAVIRPRQPAEWLAEAFRAGPLGPWRSIEAEDLDPDHPIEVRISGRSNYLKNRDPIEGRVTAVAARHPFEYPDRDVLLFDLIETTIDTVPGDSGSALLDAANRPLGLLVGRTSERSYFVHMRNVVEEMGLSDL